MQASLVVIACAVGVLAIVCAIDIVRRWKR